MAIGESLEDLGNHMIGALKGRSKTLYEDVLCLVVEDEKDVKVKKYGFEWI